ncbi:MAG: porin family protein [Halomonas sp.]
MKTLTLTALTSALLAAGITAAQAQQPPYPQGYVGGDAMFWELDPDGPGGSRDSVGLRVNGGLKFNDYFAVEGHLGGGGSDGGAELDSLVGLYGKGILPVSRDFRLYGLAGMTDVDFDADSESGFSYGAGAEYDVAPNLSLGADFVRYLDEDQYDFDAASVGLRYRF